MDKTKIVELLIEKDVLWLRDNFFKNDNMKDLSVKDIISTDKNKKFNLINDIFSKMNPAEQRHLEKLLTPLASIMFIQEGEKADTGINETLFFNEDITIDSIRICLNGGLEINELIEIVNDKEKKIGFIFLELAVDDVQEHIRIKPLLLSLIKIFESTKICIISNNPSADEDIKQLANNIDIEFIEKKDNFDWGTKVVKCLRDAGYHSAEYFVPEEGLTSEFLSIINAVCAYPLEKCKSYIDKWIKVKKSGVAESKVKELSLLKERISEFKNNLINDNEIKNIKQKNVFEQKIKEREEYKNFINELDGLIYE